MGSIYCMSWGIRYSKTSSCRGDAAGTSPGGDERYTCLKSTSMGIQLRGAIYYCASNAHLVYTDFL